MEGAKEMSRRGGRGRTLTGRALQDFWMDSMKQGAIMQALKKFEYKQGVARKEELYKKLKKEGLTDKDIKKHLGVLIRSGDIFSPRPEYYRRTAYRPRKRRKKR